MNRYFFFILTLVLALPLIHSCGKSSSGDGVSLDRQDREEAADETEIDGTYMAKFETLNPHVNGTLPGSLTFHRTGDRIISFLRLFAGKPRTWHQQGVYMGRRCPNLGDDLNKDGFIDIEEGMKVFGKMVIPLDANLNSQSAGRNFYPLSDLSGYYHYERVASFQRMFDDLHGEDFDSEDHIVKLSAGQKWTFHNKVVVVMGVDEETPLPETVSGLGKRKAFQALPITCGIIRKIKTTPGTINSGEIPGPVAEVEEGQDRPAPEEEEEPGETGGTSGGTGGSNESDDGEVGDHDHGGISGGGTTTGGSTAGGTTTGGGSTTGGTTTGGTPGETTGGSSGGTSGGSSGGIIGGFIGGFIGGSSGGSTQGGSTGGGTTGGSTTGGRTN